MGIINKEFDADLKPIEKVTKKFIQKRYQYKSVGLWFCCIVYNTSRPLIFSR
jgi:hypothetical protein